MKAIQDEEKAHNTGSPASMIDDQQEAKFKTSPAATSIELDSDSPCNTSNAIHSTPNQPFQSLLHELLFILTATTSIATSSLLQGAITVTSSSIGHSLRMTVAEITWITASNALSAGAFLLFFAKLCDLFCSRRTLFLASLALFSLFSLGAGFARDAITLDVLNGILGLFNASAVPAAQGLLSLSYPRASRRRNLAFACFAAGNPLGFAFGAIFGGVAATVWNWRAEFWVIAAVFGVFTIIGAWTIPQDQGKKEALTKETIKRFDVIGVVCVVLGIGMFSAALSLGDTAPQGWTTPYVLALLLLGLCFLLAFILWDLRLPATHALIPLHIFRDRTFTLALAILSLGFLAFTPGTFFYALSLQTLGHFSPLLVAVHLLPMFLIGILANAAAGTLLHRLSNKTLMALASACYTLAFLLLSLNRRSSSYWAFAFPAQILIVVAADVQFNVCNMLVMTRLPASQQSVAGGIFQTAVRLMAVVGLGVATAVFNAVKNSGRMSGYWDEETRPYAAVFLVSMAYSAASMGLVPFLTLGTQGGEEEMEAEDQSGMEKS